MAKVSTSILTCDFSDIKSEICSINNSDYIHIDVMDGHFVPNITIGIPVVRSIDKFTDIPLDVHLMISNPLDFVHQFCDAGADIVTVHVESCFGDELLSVIQTVKGLGKRIGLSLKPGTPVSSVLPYIELVDVILVMTVEPGFGGQSFVSDTLDKIREIRSISSVDIEVDGGINLETARLCVDSGATMLVSGSYIFNSDNRKEAISGLFSI